MCHDVDLWLHWGHLSIHVAFSNVAMWVEVYWEIDVTKGIQNPHSNMWLTVSKTPDFQKSVLRPWQFLALWWAHKVNDKPRLFAWGAVLFTYSFLKLKAIRMDSIKNIYYCVVANDANLKHCISHQVIGNNGLPPSILE